jgi:inosine-uridine nucleoside N-ribohydrolase
MKRNIFLILLLPVFVGFAQKPVPIIFDTDIAPDYDDVGAMALLHAFADQGEAAILATISSNAFETTVPTLSVLNTYFKRPGIPIGVTRSKEPNKLCSQQWAQAIIQKYPHNVRSNEQAEEAVTLYRKILAQQADHSVTIVSVGFFTNLANLLGSLPDKYSSLNGKELVKKKVNHLVSMAASLEKEGKEGYEFNVVVDAAASQKVFSEWPTPVILSGFGIGLKILTGIHLIHNDSIQNSPVKDAFRVALSKDSNTVGRNSWDETAVLVAVRGIKPYFTSRKLSLEIKADGKDVLVPGEKFDWLEFSKTPEEIAGIIEELMMHQPK